MRDLGKWNGEDYKVVTNIIWKGGSESNKKRERLEKNKLARGGGRVNERGGG